jgi:histidine triad (HIT) family protein
MVKEECIFCKFAKNEIKVPRVYESENFFVINDNHPIKEGHCLIIPKKHYINLLDMPSSLGVELLDIAKKQGTRLIKEGKGEGFNLLQNNFSSAGQEVMHFHWHIVPRKKGDGLFIFAEK